MRGARLFFLLRLPFFAVVELTIFFYCFPVVPVSHWIPGLFFPVVFQDQITFFFWIPFFFPLVESCHLSPGLFFQFCFAGSYWFTTEICFVLVPWFVQWLNQLFVVLLSQAPGFFQWLHRDVWFLKRHKTLRCPGFKWLI